MFLSKNKDFGISLAICSLFLCPLLEEELHANVVKPLNIFDFDSLIELELIILIHLEDKQLIDFLLHHYKILSRQYCKHSLWFWKAHWDDLVRLSCLCGQKLDRDLILLFHFKRFSVNYENLINFGNKDLTELGEIQTFRSLHILLNDWNSKVMNILSFVNSEGFLTSLVRYSESNLRTKQQLVASHKVEHDIL